MPKCRRSVSVNGRYSPPLPPPYFDCMGQDECWAGVHRLRQLRSTSSGRAIVQPKTPPHADPVHHPTRLHDISQRGAMSPCRPQSTSDARLIDRGGIALGEERTAAFDELSSSAPLRRAVVEHSHLLSRALRLFDVIVMDGGTTVKAVINGPVRVHACRNISKRRRKDTVDSRPCGN